MVRSSEDQISGVESMGSDSGYDYIAFDPESELQAEKKNLVGLTATV